jgi:thioredoxin 1
MQVITLSKENFKNVVESNDLVVIDFGADWCGPCMSFSPVFEQIAVLNQDIVFGILDIDADPQIAEQFNVKQIPCVLAIKEQVIIDGQVGDMPVAAFEALIECWRDFDVSSISEHFQKKSA